MFLFVSVFVYVFAFLFSFYLCTKYKYKYNNLYKYKYIPQKIYVSRVKYSKLQDFIAESIFPSHIIVPRCSGFLLHRCDHHQHHHHQHHDDDHAGVCLDKVGETCLPKRKPKVVSHEVVLYSINGTQVKIDNDNEYKSYENDDDDHEYQ